jgi:hypothetical protein
MEDARPAANSAGQDGGRRQEMRGSREMSPWHALTQTTQDLEPAGWDAGRAPGAQGLGRPKTQSPLVGTLVARA